jgi:multidrug efflux pump subunit AcrA (membrane-fusion protein)
LHADLKPLADAARRVIEERCGLALEAAGPDGAVTGRFQLGQPVEVEGELRGAVVLEVGKRADAQLADDLEALRWGVGWLVAQLRRDAVLALDARAQQMALVLDLLAALPERERFQAAATHFATEAAARLGCERASLGFERRGRMQLAAISHSAQFGKNTNLVRALEAVMDEVAEQGQALVFPDPGGAERRSLRAHEQLASEFGAAGLCSVPLLREGRVCGVLVLERGSDQPFEPATLAVVEATGALAGPLLDGLRREDRWIGAKVADSLRASTRALFGPGPVAAKLIASAAVLAIAFFALVRGDHRVTAPVVLEAELQRAAVAPFSGYLAEAPRRAGELVVSGELLARLDDRELRLEHLRWQSELEQLVKQNRQALAERDAPKVRILSAGIDRARAQIALLDDQLGRTRVLAPFDGIIVSGDLSQSLGAPVERGDVLFEVAPLDRFRVVLKVDESDVRHVAAGQGGQLALAAAPDAPLDFEVVQVTPVSTAEEGRNSFRVEAQLRGELPDLRPGMEGVGKIEAGRRRLLWIWTHEAFDWLRLALWRWLP